jgi:hypothetical protein
LYYVFLDQYEKKSGKKSKVRNVPPLLDMLEQAGGGTHKKAPKKDAQGSSKLHSKLYK